MNWDFIFKQYRRSVPRWVVLAIDVAICLLSALLSYLLLEKFYLPTNTYKAILTIILSIVSIRLISFLIAKTHYGIIKFSGTQDAFRIFITLFLGSVLMIILDFFIEKYYQGTTIIHIPHSLIIIDFFISYVLMTFSRLGYRMVYTQLSTDMPKKTNVIIYGAGQLAIITKRTLDIDNKINYRVTAFIDDNKKVHKHRIDNVPIYSPGNLKKLVESHKIHELIIAIQNISVSKKAKIIEECIDLNIKVKNIPPADKWINGEFSAKQIKKVNIEDLLNREEIKLNDASISQNILGKVILISGAAGSIGSEIVRQLIKFYPSKIILLDQGETAVYELEHELNDNSEFKKFDPNIDIVICDIRNRTHVETVFQKYQLDVIYHAAAYKHVPLMEISPNEAIHTNVMGTKNLADFAIKYQVPKFVMVSTDKAVNPTNIMGASKRIAEMYVQSLNFNYQNKKTKFITTRFGNVLGSNGSVIPYFRKQIAAGGPVTVTHPDITRYFMTIPEACQLVIEAGNMGKGGEIFIFDMGQPIKIVDLASKMISLSGLQVGKDIKIVFTGLRNGEKLYEELLNNNENTLATHHPKIMIAKINPLDFEKMSAYIDELRSILYCNEMELVSKIKEIVPEYISNNSKFEELDKIKQK